MRELNEHISNIISKHSSGEWKDLQVYEAIQEMLNVNGGKLYKYRRFDSSGHSLVNLKNQELYCSQPSKFNDPFDSRIGIDLKALATSQFSPIEQMLEDALKVLLSVLRGEEALEECPLSLQPIIMQLIKHSDFCTFIEQCDRQQFSYIKIVEYLHENPTSISCIIPELIELVLVQSGFERNGITTEIFTKILGSLDPNQLVINDDEGIDILASYTQANGIVDDVDQITLMKNIFQMQQPGESHELDAMDEQFYQLDTNLRELIDQNFYIGCLSEDHNNVLMWSHYAESHTGFCIEYDFNRINLSEEQLLILPALYTDERSPFPFGITSGMIVDEQSTLKYEFILSLLMKDSAWSYEKEWRILRSKAPNNEVVSLPIVSGVYLGANCTQENKDKILSITHTLQIPAYQMVVDRGVYKLHALSL